jgi:hypothetical protein
MNDNPKMLDRARASVGKPSVPAAKERAGTQRL